ncbi:PfkB family carbohydrate kinase, partial [Salmonella enterica]|uniref:PfkB family carbohydrate kinase n=1 Tax=Salmonella enterica TaxID=28901 RepID=UPI001F50141E
PGETVTGSHYQVAFGGKGANQAVAAGRSGANIAFIACTGDDDKRVVGLAQARFNAGIIAGSRVSEAKIPALREQCNGLLLQGQWL